MQNVFTIIRETLSGVADRIRRAMAAWLLKDFSPVINIEIHLDSPEELDEEDSFDIMFSQIVAANFGEPQ